MSEWRKSIDLACKTADLVAADRVARGRPAGSAGTLRARYQECEKQMVRMLREMNEFMDRVGL